jgi:catechol 2,3-dioxygenase-like lactoylglutathione lyase family enzyme
MSRVQLALRVADLEGSVAFYAKLFDTQPAKLRPGYANFAIAEPPLKLVLIEGEGAGEGAGVGGLDTRLDHLGVEVDSTAQVAAAAGRLRQAGLTTSEENGTTCCYAVQDKVWVTAPGNEPWEVYVVTSDADTFAKSDTCCTGAAQPETPTAGCVCGS